MAELSNETKEDTCMDKELLSLMEKSLPMYAVKCFLYAGYDNIPAITQMVTEGLQNSIDEIEIFILKYYPRDKSCYPPTFVESHNETMPVTPTFVFLPGHRFLINAFINDIKVKHSLNSKKSRKGYDHDATSHPNKTKKQKVTCTAEEEISSKQSYDLQFISDDVHKRIVKWQRRQDFKEMKELVEHTDYRVSFKLDISNHLEVSIWCGMCNKHFRLNQKEVACGNTVMMISN